MIPTLNQGLTNTIHKQCRTTWALISIFVSTLLISNCSPLQRTVSPEPISSIGMFEASSTPMPSPTPVIETEVVMGKDRLKTVAEFLPKLQSTSKDPAWIGIVLEEGCECYFQYRFHDGQFWLEYMLFPEEQLVIEAEFKSAILAHDLNFNEVELVGEDKYLEVPLGSDIDSAFSLSMAVIKTACQVEDQAEVEFLNELD